MSILNIEFKILIFLFLLNLQKRTFSKFLDYQQFVRDMPNRDNIKVELNNRLILKKKKVHEDQKQSMYVGQASIVTSFLFSSANKQCPHC